MLSADWKFEPGQSIDTLLATQTKTGEHLTVGDCIKKAVDNNRLRNENDRLKDTVRGLEKKMKDILIGPQP